MCVCVGMLVNTEGFCSRRHLIYTAKSKTLRCFSNTKEFVVVITTYLFLRRSCVAADSPKYTWVCLNISVCVYQIRQSKIYMNLFKHMCVPDQIVQNIYESDGTYVFVCACTRSDSPKYTWICLNMCLCARSDSPKYTWICSNMSVCVCVYPIVRVS
jgi:hypothetical protein